MSFANPIGIAASIAVPALVALQPTRQRAFVGALLYYGGASWALIPAAAGFLGRETSALTAIFLWCSRGFLLAGPWAFLWTPVRRQLCWRVPVALIAGIVPPLGLIGWASPLTAAGLLFPGTGWFGLVAATIVLAGALAVRPRQVAPTGAALILVAHAMYPGDPSPPFGWQAINTQFGASDPADITTEYLRAQGIQQRSRVSEARVIIFPESVLSQWTEATDLFWKETLASLRDSGRTILIGAHSADDRNRGSPTIQFLGRATALQGSSPADERFGIQEALRTSTVPASYRNTVVIRGAASGMLDQRIPVPVGMWNPFTGSGYRSTSAAGVASRLPTREQQS